MKLSDHIFNPKHFVIHINDSLGTAKKLLTDIFISFHFLNPLFVTDLVFQGCPEIHADGTDLDFRTHRSFPFCKENGNFDDHMITAVAVGLGILDVVFDF